MQPGVKYLEFIVICRFYHKLQASFLTKFKIILFLRKHEDLLLLDECLSTIYGITCNCQVMTHFFLVALIILSSCWLGCEMALLFPMRSSRIYTSIIPDVPVSLSSFTVCMWFKPTSISNKTVLFTYGNRRNPYEIQLLLKRNAALFTIGGEAHLVEARGVVNPGRWTHLCGAWSSEQGLASLWADGVKVASTPGVAEGHVLPDGGSLQLGQERNGCCPPSLSSGSSVAGFEAGFDSKLAFVGKMTGVNMWDKVLSEDKISQLSLREGHGCEQSGNIVAWGVTEMVPHGGAQFI